MGMYMLLCLFDLQRDIVQVYKHVTVVSYSCYWSCVFVGVILGDLMRTSICGSKPAILR